MQKTFEVDTLTLLDPDSLEFSREESGFMTLKFDGETYNRVALTRLVPFMSKTEYISCTFEKDGEWIEIGVIRDTELLSDAQRNIVTEFLEFKYYMPEVTKIISIKDNRMGYLFVDMLTTSGEKTICINDWWTNFKLIGLKRLNITDVDGNKYYVPDVDKLDAESQKKLELFI